jgi:hypothetical protein
MSERRSAYRARRAPKAPHITHNQLKTLIVNYLELHGWLAWKNNSGAFPVEDGTHARRFVQFGKRGSADILALSPDGVFYSIECKVGSDKLRPEQVQWMQDVAEHGGTAIVARSLDDVRALVEPNGDVVRIPSGRINPETHKIEAA